MKQAIYLDEVYVVDPEGRDQTMEVYQCPFCSGTVGVDITYLEQQTTIIECTYCKCEIGCFQTCDLSEVIDERIYEMIVKLNPSLVDIQYNQDVIDIIRDTLAQYYVESGACKNEEDFEGVRK